MNRMVLSPKTEVIIKYCKDNPCLYYREIASKFNLTYQRIQQIRKVANLPSAKSLKMRVCEICHKRLKHRNKYNRCREHYSELFNIPLICDQCGELFYRKKTKVIHLVNKHHYNHQFCSNGCQIKFISKHYGFQKGAKSRGRGVKKWNYEEVYDKFIKLHTSYPKASKILNIPEATLFRIKKKIEQINLA